MEVSERKRQRERIERGYAEGMMMSLGRHGKLHESGFTVHQLNEPHTADKDDERNNDDSGGANRGLFLDAFSLPGVCNCVLGEPENVS